MKKIILLGSMGSGKSIVGELLASKLGLQHYDLDQIIEQSEAKTISELFHQKGEVYFRKIESQLFRELLEKDTSFVLCIGGGTPCYANNHLLLQQEDVLSFYLNTSTNCFLTEVFIITKLNISSIQKAKPLTKLLRK